MPKGYAGRILQIDLTAGSIEVQEYDQEFYRTYLGGGGFGASFLLSRTDGNTDPLGPGNVLTLAPGLTTGPAVSGASRCSVTALSPETGGVGDSQAGGNFGPFLKRSGFDAVVITGRAEKPSWIYIAEGKAEIRSAETFTGNTILDVWDLIAEELGSQRISVVQCGPAGERMAVFANLASDLRDYFGRTGMGAVFGSKNLRAVAASGAGTLEFFDPEAVKRIAKSGASRVSQSGFVSIIKQYGTPGLVEGNAASGNLCTRNYSSGWHPDALGLDGKAIEKSLASSSHSCYGCVVGCRKSIKAEGSDDAYAITDRLGGPEFETLGVMGSNLEILDPAVVGKANELCNNYGLDTITLGGIISYLFEAIAEGMIEPEELGEGFEDAGFGSARALLALIEAAAAGTGIGAVLAGGFAACIAHFGEKTRRCAVAVKNHGFAVHMPQVKPAMALMYAVSPIGADHMSCEHDWLITETGEAAKGLGLTVAGRLNSTGPDKVRMVVYSQFYYSMLDSLGLCMFCWGAGNLFTYAELEQLITAVTGLEMTFFELMKAGERRITMMRQINLRRGIGRQTDELPQKMFEPLAGGPSAGRKVDRESFAQMVRLYYGFMGWDSDGVPLQDTLLELGVSGG
jgi:aldehyde:ferredoxin oxidoreductase